MVVTGCFSGSHRNPRICSHCNATLADERHVVLEFSLLQPLRQRLADLCTSETDNTRPVLACHWEIREIPKIGRLPRNMRVQYLYNSPIIQICTLSSTCAEQRWPIEKCFPDRLVCLSTDLKHLVGCSVHLKTQVTCDCQHSLDLLVVSLQHSCVVRVVAWLD